MRRIAPFYRIYPWKRLIKDGSNGCAESLYGRNLMRQMMESLDKDSYCELAANGCKILADALDTDRDYNVDCPALLLCGTKDKAGSARRYNRKWAKLTGLPLIWIKDAGHNSNTDKPDEVNEIIRTFVERLEAE